MNIFISFIFKKLKYIFKKLKILNFKINNKKVYKLRGFY